MEILELLDKDIKMVSYRFKNLSRDMKVIYKAQIKLLKTKSTMCEIKKYNDVLNS
jgi:hypothetical protein